MAANLSLNSQSISSYLLGNNYWWPGSYTLSLMAPGGKMDVANFQTIRIGGFGANDYSNSSILSYVKTIKAMGAQPIIQVDAASTAAEATTLITYINVTNGQGVKLWSIGNEPDHTNGGSKTDAQIQTYIKSISAALKAVDATIKVIGPEFSGYSSSRYANLIGGGYSITGLVTGKTYYYVDIISFHKYDIAYAYELDGTISDLVSKINAENTKRPSAPLTWGIGEFNSHWDNDETTDANKKTCSFNAGQLFAGVYGRAMQYGATFVCAWSIYEGHGDNNDQNCTGTDLSLFYTDLSGRSSYYHSLMLGQNMRSTYAASTENATGFESWAMKEIEILQPKVITFDWIM
jgi:hypothetical protein